MVEDKALSSDTNPELSLVALSFFGAPFSKISPPHAFSTSVQISLGFNVLLDQILLEISRYVMEIYLVILVIRFDQEITCQAIF